MKKYFIILFIFCCLGCNEYSRITRRNENEIQESEGLWQLKSKKSLFSSPFEKLMPEKLVLSIEQCTFDNNDNLCIVKYKIDENTEKSATFRLWANPAKNPVIRMTPLENKQGYSEKEIAFHESGIEITNRSSNNLFLTIAGGKISYDLELVKQ